NSALRDSRFPRLGDRAVIAADPLGGEALAPLAAPPLEREPACARSHPGTEPVGTGSLAFLWLVSALHDRSSPAALVFPPQPERGVGCDRPASAGGWRI